MTYKILIADDESLIRMDLYELLTEMGYDVVAQAEDGLEALEKYGQTKPDVCILDVRMPGKTGIEIARQIAEHVPIILLTAYSESDLIRQAKKAGVSAYLTKPFKAKDISPAIEFAVRDFLTRTKLTDQVKHLENQLETRKLVEQAKGILMKSQHMPEAKAYRHIQQLSMKKNISMRKVAEAIIVTSDLG